MWFLSIMWILSTYNLHTHINEKYDNALESSGEYYMTADFNVRSFRLYEHFVAYQTSKKAIIMYSIN